MKKRIDILLTEKDPTLTRAKAQSLIMSGRVFVNGQRVDKPGTAIPEDSEIEVRNPFPYVSRGALKIKKAVDEFALDLKDKVICDIGSSTGGFTDFAIQNGSKKVYAIDVGRGQLDYSLRNNKKVVVMERTDFRKVSPFFEKIDFFFCDVSFISLRKILPKIKELVSGETKAVLLVKPQFEVGKEIADRHKGVIKDTAIREEVLAGIKQFASKEGFSILGETESPITGAKGNVEYLLYLGLRNES